MKFLGVVETYLKPKITDPEADTERNSLVSLGYDVTGVTLSKTHQVYFNADDAASARKTLEEMTERLLINPHSHNYEIIRIEEVKSDEPSNEG